MLTVSRLNDPPAPVRGLGTVFWVNGAPTPQLGDSRRSQLLGWRTWMVVPVSEAPASGSVLPLPALRLQGARAQVWESAVLNAECRPLLFAARTLTSSTPGFAPKVPSSHLPPGPACSCGVYASKSRTLALSQLSAPVFALGEVRLFGDVAEHEDGFRASSAEMVGPLSLLVAGRCGLCPRSAAPHPPSSLVWFRQYPSRFVGACAAAVGDALRTAPHLSSRPDLPPPAVFPVAEWLTAAASSLKSHYGVDVVAPQLISMFNSSSPPDCSSIVDVDSIVEVDGEGVSQEGS